MNAMRIILLVSFGVGAVVGPIAAEEKWVLWDRPLDSQGEGYGDWRRGPEFDTERWCKGAMTTAINQAVTQTIKVPKKPTLVEYQCLPESADANKPDGKR